MLASKQRTNLNSLSEEQRKSLTKATFEGKSYFQQLYHCDEKNFPCQDVAVSLRNQIIRLLIKKNIVQTSIELENLHLCLSDEMKEYNFNDGVNKLSTFFYETDEIFMRSWQDFIKYIRNEVVQEPFYFQETPTIRLHCPNARNSNHYPRYHTDVGYGHPPEEINIWLPLTELHAPQGHGFRLMNFENSRTIMDAYDYNFSSFIEDAIHDKAFSKKCDTMSHPVLTPFGSLIAFDSRCIHTGEPLLEHTRASIDIRVLPVSLYNNMEIEYQGSGRRKIIFIPGNCYHPLNSDEFLSRI